MSAANNGTNWERPRQPWACPAGMQLASADLPRSNREQWLEMRRGMICASDVAALVGASKWGDQYTVWADKTGRVAPSATTRAQARGLIFEDPILELWAKHDADFPIEFRRMGLMRSRLWPHLGATVDRVSICPLGRCLAEVKSAADTQQWEDDEVPVEYQFQGQTQLAVTGRDHVHFIALGPRFIILHRVMFRDEEMIREIGNMAEQVWEVNIVGDLMPPATHIALETAQRLTLPDPANTCEIDDELAVHVHEARAARQGIADQSTAFKTAMANIYAAMGSATTLAWPDGQVELTWNPGKTVDGADADWRKAHAELAAKYSQPKDELDVKALVADHPELIDNRELRYRRTTSWK